MHFEQKNKRETAKEMRERKARRKQEGELIGQNCGTSNLKTFYPKSFTRASAGELHRQVYLKSKWKRDLLRIVIL